MTFGELYPVGRECHNHYSLGLKSTYGWLWEYSELPKNLQEDIYFMCESILNDPIKKPNTTNELGLSQAYRLYRFLNQEKNIFQVSLEELDFAGLPTIGAEFHLPKSKKDICRDIFLLNMAQYHDDSKISLSGSENNWKEIEPCLDNKKKIVEIRTNPSYYPVTIANWNLMKNFVPLNETYYNLTITPLPTNNKRLKQLKSLMNLIYADNYCSLENETIKGKDYNFSRGLFSFSCALGTFFIPSVIISLFENLDPHNHWLVYSLISSVLGAGTGYFLFKDSYTNTNGDLGFGEHYLGQTQKVNKGKLEFFNPDRELNGEILGIKEWRDKYQLNLYCGFGDIFPKQAYYASMAYLDDKILHIVGQEVGNNLSLKKAVKMEYEDISNVLNKINNHIKRDTRLTKITKKGQEIIGSFK